MAQIFTSPNGQASNNNNLPALQWPKWQPYINIPPPPPLNKIYLSISAHRIPPFRCHHSEHPRLFIPRFRPSGRFQALKKALFTVTDPTHHASYNAEIVKYLFRKRLCMFL